MKILLIGANGQIGHELARQLPSLGKVTALDRTHMDLTDLDQVRAVIRHHQPQLLINAAAYTAVDQAESEPELAMRINAEAPAVMAQEAQALGAGMIHYSTDYVFDGSKDGSYVEDDATNPLNVYGRSKLAGELAVAKYCDTHLILRCSWVYGLHGNNFLKTIMRLSRERDSLRVVNDQFGAPTAAFAIAHISGQMIAQLPFRQSNWQALFKERNGIYHVAATGETSWHGYALHILDQMRACGLELTTTEVLPVASIDYPTTARRPLNSRLQTDKLHRCFQVSLPDWRQDLDVCIARLATRTPI